MIRLDQRTAQEYEQDLNAILSINRRGSGIKSLLKSKIDKKRKVYRNTDHTLLVLSKKIMSGMIKWTPSILNTSLKEDDLCNGVKIEDCDGNTLSQSTSRTPMRYIELKSDAITLFIKRFGDEINPKAMFFYVLR